MRTATAGRNPPERAVSDGQTRKKLLKGVHTLTPPTQSGPVTGAPTQVTAAVATLLGPCVAPPGVAGFSEYVYAAATMIDGETRESQYDASAAIAFALAPT